MNEGINLLNTNKKKATIVPVKRMGWMRLFAGSLLFLVSVSSLILFLLVALSPLPALQKQEQSLRLTLSQSNADIAKLSLINDRTTAIAQLLKKRQSLDQTIALLEEHLGNDVSVSAIRADHDTMSITLESSSLQSLDTFVKGVLGDVQNKKGFSQVTMTDLSRDGEKGEYSLTLSLVLF